MMAKKDLHTVFALKVSNDIARIRITSAIGLGLEVGANSEDIRKDIDEALSSGIQRAEVYINSKGGSVFETNEIVNELKRFEDVKVRVGALAASAATFIVSQFHTTAQMNSQFMFHKPSMITHGNEQDVESALKLLKDTTENYIAAYAEKTGKSEEDISTMLSKGDVWMTASEALKEGFIDAIDKESKTGATAEDVAVLTACGAPMIPKIENQKTKQMKRSEMMLAVMAALQLSVDATDEEILTAAKGAKGDQALLKEVQANADKLQAERVDHLISQAILEKKISADQKEVYAKLAATDYESTEKALQALQPIPKLSAHVGHGRHGQAAERKDWSLQDYQEKDPEALNRLYEEDPEKAKELERAYFV